MRFRFPRIAPFARVALAVVLLAAPSSGRLLAQDQAARAALVKSLDALRTAGDAPALPDAARFTFGDRTLAAGSAADGGAAVANGTLTLRGTVNGDAVAWHGDVVVAPGAVVHGNAVAIAGKVRLEGGLVDGDVRALVGDLGQSAPADAPKSGGAVARSLVFTAAWLAVLIIIGIGVLVVASPNLDAVTDALEASVGRALIVGIAGQVAIIPVLTVLCVALTLTILGILLIPFAVVAYVLVVAGLLTLGFLAVARIVGRALRGAAKAGGTGDRERRAAALFAVVAGVVILMAPWFLASSLAWSPLAHVIVRTMAVAITWVAATAGLGATLISRGGVRRRTAPAAVKAMNAASWQTPTPIGGVVAARRPTPYSTPVQK